MWNTERKIDVLLQWLWRMGSVRLLTQSARENASAGQKAKESRAVTMTISLGPCCRCTWCLRQWAMDP